jgi:hypothetical protein
MAATAKQQRVRAKFAAAARSGAGKVGKAAKSTVPPKAVAKPVKRATVKKATAKKATVKKPKKAAKSVKTLAARARRGST